LVKKAVKMTSKPLHHARRLAPRNDPRNPWTARYLLPFFIELDNRVLDRFSAEERQEYQRPRLPWW
jgi:hypothetical protein